MEFFCFLFKYLFKCIFLHVAFITMMSFVTVLHELATWQYSRLLSHVIGSCVSFWASSQSRRGDAVVIGAVPTSVDLRAASPRNCPCLLPAHVFIRYLFICLESNILSQDLCLALGLEPPLGLRKAGGGWHLPRVSHGQPAGRFPQSRLF